MFYFRGMRKPDFKNIKKIDYDEYWRTRGFALRGKFMEREQIFFDWIAPNSRVLDVGCGSSRLLLELKEKKNCSVLGVDSSAIVLEGQKKAGVEVRLGDIESTEFNVEGYFDYIILSEVLEHLRDSESLVSKLAPHARHLAISVPNSAFYRYRFGLMFKGRFFTQWRYHPAEHLRFWSHSDFLEWLSALGLDVEKTVASNGFWFKDICPNLFGHQICYLVSTGKK